MDQEGGKIFIHASTEYMVMIEEETDATLSTFVIGDSNDTR